MCIGFIGTRMRYRATMCTHLCVCILMYMHDACIYTDVDTHILIHIHVYMDICHCLSTVCRRQRP